MHYKFGLIAKDIHNSVTPTVYKTFGRDLGMDIDFEIFNVPQEQLMSTVTTARNGLDGFNVTMPYKVKMMDLVDELDESAVRCGSTNVVAVMPGRKLKAYNTDGWGLVKALALQGCSFNGRKVVMVGAGGVALSIAYNLSINGVTDVEVLNKFPVETERLCGRFGPLFHGHGLDAAELKKAATDADFFINASVLGQVGYDDYTDLSFLDSLKHDAVVFDCNYSKPNAALPAAARAKGLRTFVGRMMSTCQGIRAMEIWTGRTPSDDSARRLIDKENQGGNR